MKYTVRFAHLSEVLVSVGDPVLNGKKIGVMGNTGVGTGPHLHLDVTKGANRLRYSLADMMLIA